MPDELPGAATVTDAPATTGTSTAGEAKPATTTDPSVITKTQAEWDAEAAKVRKAAAADALKKAERDAAAKSKPVEERLTDLERENEALRLENASGKHVTRAITAAARLGFTSERYIRDALADAMAADPESIDYGKVAAAAVEMAKADGLLPASAAAGTAKAEGTEDAGVITPNQNGSAPRQVSDLANMDRSEALIRSVKDPEWRKNVWEPHLQKLRENANRGIKE